MSRNYTYGNSRIRYRIRSLVSLCVAGYATLELGNADDLGRRASDDLLADVGSA